jgi:hypothetical protein
MIYSTIKQLGILGCGVAATLAIAPGIATPEAKAEPMPQILAQEESAEPVESCSALQEVTTGETEIRKRIENRVFTSGNWNTDFLVPSNQDISYFVALVTPENTGPYELTINLAYANSNPLTAVSRSATVDANTTYAIPFQSAIPEQPFRVNARVGGVNGNVYTIAIVGCEE